MLLFIITLIFVISLLIGIPLVFSLGLTSFGALIYQKISLVIIPQQIIGGLNKYPLLCVPFFILAGSLMNAGQITQRVINFSNLLVGSFRGALGLVNVLTSMFFAGVSGSALADTSSIGAILIPAMKKEGYGAKFSAAITASSSICGPIIPPSIPMVILGLTAGIPIGRLFLGGALPGIVLGLVLMLGAWIVAIKEKYPKHERASFMQIIKGFKGSFTALLMPIIIVGGIISGLATVAEIGALAVLYALAVGLFINKELNVKSIFACLQETVTMTGIVVFIIGVASLFSWVLTVSGIPQKVCTFIFQFTTNKIAILLLMNLFLLIVGTFMEGIAAILLLTPVLLPLAEGIGMDLTHFGVMMVFNLMLGMLTPPVGLCLYISMRFAKISLIDVSVAVMPFLLLGLIVLMVVTFFPAFSLYLPNLLL